MAEQTDGSKAWAIGKLMHLPDEQAYANEDQALELAYSMKDPRRKELALKVIADRMTT